ncbi:hypothetical protein [Streptomyces sp. NPDC056061]|uniref:hypothetical protein n=1 Tax=Streptomyces sp. NPDC056061 TaxID=3345700 RepID=UPI0035DA9811
MRQSHQPGRHPPRPRPAAIHERIARVGTVLDFIAWFDQTWKPEEAQEGEAA